MVSDIQQWMQSLLAQLQGTFARRLLFLGLQGSYHRGEANEQSDVDIVMVLDQLSLQDLAAYKRILAALPEYEKCCGFCCGVAELRAWPRCDFFHLLWDTEPYHGRLADLLETPPSREDITMGMRLGAGNLYHALCHDYLYLGDTAKQYAKLKSSYKSAFYTVQLRAFLRTGQYYATRAELSQHIEGLDLTIMETYSHWQEASAVSAPAFEALFQTLLGWCQDVLAAS